MINTGGTFNEENDAYDSSVLHQVQFSNRAALTMQGNGYDITRGTHGAKFVEGQTTIDPGENVGRNNHQEFSHTNRAYFTAHNGPEKEALVDRRLTPPMPSNNYDRISGAERAGWSWAQSARNSDDTHARTGESVRGRDVVHEVEPVGHVDGDPILNPRGEDGGSATADSLTIKDTNWIPPSRGDGRWNHVQGTLPNYNWNKQAPTITMGGKGARRNEEHAVYDDYNAKSFDPTREYDKRENNQMREANNKYFQGQARASHSQQILGQGQFAGTEDYGKNYNENLLKLGNALDGP